MNEPQIAISTRRTKRVLIALCAATVLVVAAIALVEAAHRPRELVIPVSDMTCKGCEASLRDKLAELPGVIQVDPSHQNDQVSVLVDGWSGPEQAVLEAAILRAGYTVAESTTH